MKSLLRMTVAAGALLAAPTFALADCGIESGSVRILSNDFEALHVVAAGAEECASATVEVTKNQTTEHKNIQVAALTTNPATYTVAVVANNSVVPLLNDGLIRPLDDLVAKYGQNLEPTQLIKIDGKVMAIAFMANAQHLHYRKDLLEEAGLEPPTSYEDILADAAVLREKGIVATPLAANFKPGFDLAEEFVNMYLGYGGEFFEPGTPNASIVNEKGVAALETMKAMSDFMGPDFMTFNTNAIKPMWEASEVAILNGWGSRASALIDTEGPAPEVAANTVLAAAPTVGGGTTPAATLWWDGFTIAKNISDEDAEASFQAMMHGIRPEVAQEHAPVAVWLIKGYEPTPAAVGVIETLKAGAKPFPMLPYMGVLFTALGENLAEFMQGQESAEQALEDATQAYNTAAREAGFLN
ncbi:MAG: extracellular solute-binding protein [Rhodobacteraceae bacterium]|uniref:ABC transporter substrate-binding protein n=1 Tax=Amaricoccus sp. TaxID=1872485 RepID=UPI001DB7F364|nr:extracellular solute-binding protein [Amaricoccus sp.]MCB1375160.1 extracellular solute-binding protein [Paracoccaceae bacterium]MCB1401342.1 extracellular solute-binding protein [Paracoccaceae bacterium]HRW15127.1 extracellular solute-binding protein [Amaricoccus sp.]